MVVWDQDTSQRLAKKRFPRKPIRVTVEKDIVVLNSMSSLRPIYVWDLCTDQVRPIGPLGYLQLWHVNMDKNVLVAFEVDWKRQKCGRQSGH